MTNPYELYRLNDRTLQRIGEFETRRQRNRVRASIRRDKSDEAVTLVAYDYGQFAYQIKV